MPVMQIKDHVSGIRASGIWNGGAELCGFFYNDSNVLALD